MVGDADSHLRPASPSSGVDVKHDNDLALLPAFLDPNWDPLDLVEGLVEGIEQVTQLVDAMNRPLDELRGRDPLDLGIEVFAEAFAAAIEGLVGGADDLDVIGHPAQRRVTRRSSARPIVTGWLATVAKRPRTLTGSWAIPMS